jgi:hypothetical protein
MRRGEDPMSERQVNSNMKAFFFAGPREGVR